MQAYVKHIIMRFVVPWLIYRLPLSLAAPLLPKYRFGIEPAQLACLTHLIDCLTPPPAVHRKKSGNLRNWHRPGLYINLFA